MNLPRNTYYHKSKSDFGDESELIPQIEAIIEDFPGYGYRRNIIVNHKKVLRIMRQRGLLRKTQRRWVKTTDSDHNQRIYPNLIKNLIVTGPNQVWTADITYNRQGNPYDNAAAESFFKTIKVEEIYLWKYRTLEDLQIRLPFFIQEVYNHKRLHSSLGYRPPVEFEELFIKNLKPCTTALTGSAEYKGRSPI